MNCKCGIKDVFAYLFNIHIFSLAHFTNTRNVIIAALILVLAIGITYSGSIQIGVVSLSGLAVASIVGILLNAILPGKDYAFTETEPNMKDADRFGGVKNN